jgi:hypothetical protein
MTANQTSVVGPKTLPMPAVPRFWTTKSPTRTATVSGRTTGFAADVATSRPSMALSTEIAGVMTPSP